MRSVVGLQDLDEIFITHLHADHYLGSPACSRRSPCASGTPRSRSARATRSARPVRLARAGLRGRLTYPVEIDELRAGDALERDGYRILVFPVERGVLGGRVRAGRRRASGRLKTSRRRSRSNPHGEGRPPTRRDGHARRRPRAHPGRGGRSRAARPACVPSPATPPQRDRSRPRRRHARPRGDLCRRGGRPSRRDDALDRSAGRRGRSRRRCAFLVLTHVSPRYFGSELLGEAREVFPDTVMPRETSTRSRVPFAERGEQRLVKGGAL